jgi:hypothetical protein
VCFRGGTVGLVRMELWAEMVQNAPILMEMNGKYVLQTFGNRNRLSVNWFYKSVTENGTRNHF